MKCKGCGVEQTLENSTLMRSDYAKSRLRRFCKPCYAKQQRERAAKSKAKGKTPTEIRRANQSTDGQVRQSCGFNHPGVMFSQEWLQRAIV